MEGMKSEVAFRVVREKGQERGEKKVERREGKVKLYGRSNYTRAGSQNFD